MAVSDNLGLYLPTREDYVSVKRDISDNFEEVDDFAGGVMNGLAIVADGDTHIAIASGQYVYIRNNPNGVSEGMYTANSAISANASIYPANVTSVSGGISNALNGKITTITYNVINPLNGYFTKRDAFRAKIKGGVAIVESYINFTTEIPANTEFASIETTGIYGSYIVINTSTRAVYYAALRSTGRFESETAIPTGYYYFVGCAT